MLNIKTYRNGDRMGTFSQLNFDNGEKILISIAQSGVKISKLGFLSFPTKTIWKTDTLNDAFTIFMKGNNTNPLGLLDSVIDELIFCNAIDEIVVVLDKLSKK